MCDVEHSIEFRKIYNSMPRMRFFENKTKVKSVNTSKITRFI